MSTPSNEFDLIQRVLVGVELRVRPLGSATTGGRPYKCMQI